MAQAALSYQQPQRRTRELELPQRPPLTVLPGNAPSRAADARLAHLWRTIFTAGIVSVLLIGSLSLVRVGLTDATMALFSESEQITRSIEEQRSEGARLEMQYSLASTPSTIQAAATELGMAPDPQVEYLRISTEE